ncbi:hypothetical protein [Aurantimonas sp. VKM B-3413]|uniref:hypothetical protein n=1 Tax=Aurantimonas sp. VKM B-3413 TaxID=2779401 RepID=UPI001E583D58|nr:hypothetical protein [Aurantimonas sp. VKM B-3413]MCB8840509.1 hypothetical protein [Aurantimonas sp. VKM B-3413]
MDVVERGPIPAIHGVVRWRRKDLVRWIFEEFRIEIDETLDSAHRLSDCHQTGPLVGPEKQLRSPCR